MEDPHPFYEELRQQGPVPYDRATGDYWVLHHADAMLVLADRRFGKAALLVLAEIVRVGDRTEV